MSTRQELISKALRGRFDEVCARVQTIDPTVFTGQQAFVRAVQERLLGSARMKLWSNSSIKPDAPRTWSTASADCMEALRSAALGESVLSREGERPAENLLEMLRSCTREPRRRFELLTRCYACPLNFVLRSEEPVREHVLEQLMVHQRARIERNSIASIDADDLLLMLNLIALNGMYAMEFRFLDALNYYYELLPPVWYTKSKHNWLLACYLAGYARALAYHAWHINRCA